MKTCYFWDNPLVESSIILTARDLLLGSKRKSISAAAALCIKESAGSEQHKHDDNASMARKEPEAD